MAVWLCLEMSKQPHPKPNRLSAVDLLPAMRDLSREPFQEVMALCLAAAPTPENLVAFAQDYPDRWANMCAIFAKLSGFSDKVDHSHAHLHLHQIHQMSDAELYAALEAESDQSKLEQIPQLADARALLLGENFTSADEPEKPLRSRAAAKNVSKLDKPPIRIIRLKRKL